MKLILIRHGDPDYENDTLTEKGKREAELLAERLEDFPMDEIYVSPLGRARHTADPMLSRRHRTAEELEWLREFEAPIFRPDKPEGVRSIPWDWMPKDWTACPEFYDYDRWMTHPRMTEGKVGEEYARVTGCFEAFLSAHGYQKDGNLFRVTKANNDTIVFFCHYGVSIVLISYLLHVSPMILWHGMVAAPTSVSALVTEERQQGYASFRLNTYGDTMHLDVNKEPRSFAARFCECFDNADQRH